MSYHNHSRWSDGRSSIAEIVEAARLAGLDEVGISDHYTLFPDGRQEDWTMERARLPEYVADVLSARAQGPIVRLGIEADYFPETWDEIPAILENHPFDYVIGSVHFLGGFPIDLAVTYWEPLSESEISDKWTTYWQRVCGLAGSRACDVIGHFDLPKKFGIAMPDTARAGALEALDAIAAAGMAMELNTAGWRVPAAESYPAPWLLREARQRGIPLLINADSHMACDVASGFERARGAAMEAGYESLVRFDKRQRYEIPLVT